MVVVTKLSTVVGDVDVPPGKGDVPPVTELLGDGDSPAVEELLGIADVATGDDEFPAHVLLNPSCVNRMYLNLSSSKE